MNDLKGYNDVVNQMTAKLAHACDVIKTKLTQESPKPVEDFEVSREGATKAIITYGGKTSYEKMDTQYLYEVLEEAVSSDPENLRYCLEKVYSCGGMVKVKIELQDHSKFLGNCEMLKPKHEDNRSAFIFNLIDENIEFHNKITAMKCILEKHNLMSEVNELLRWVEKK